MCLPLWGKWIEIRKPAMVYVNSLCLPLWGKWIEMNNVEVKCRRKGVSSPVGEVD